MMEQVIRVAAVCLVTAILAVLLKKNGAELAILLSIAAIVVVSLLLNSTIGQIVDFIRGVIRAADLLPELFAPLVKVAAIALVSRVGGDLCRDAGEGALGSVLEMAGSFGAVLVSLPLFSAVWDMLQTLL